MARQIDGGTGDGGKGLTVIDGGVPDECSPANIEHRGGDRVGSKLTAKQSKFVQNVLSGMNQSDAYRNAGYDTSRSSDKTTWENASRLFANPKVSARIKAGQARQEEVAVHSGTALRADLISKLKVLTDSKESDAVKIRAIEVLGKTELVSLFLDRSTDVPTDNLTEDEVTAQLEAKLKEFFADQA